MILINELTKDNIEMIKEILNSGGIIIYPTDTVYGIGCDCFNINALKKLYSFKKREMNKPICVLADSIEKIKLLVKEINPQEQELIDKYLPGDLTIILDKKDNVPDLLTANLKTVGVRIPNDDLALEILRSYKNPLATSSVNLSGLSPGIEVSDFYDEFKDKVDIIIDGGKSKIGVSSTIIRVEDGKIIVLRDGNIKFTQE